MEVYEKHFDEHRINSNQTMVLNVVEDKQHEEHTELMEVSMYQEHNDKCKTNTKSHKQYNRQDQF